MIMILHSTRIELFVAHMALIVFAFGAIAATPDQEGKSQWAYFNASGKLAYKTTDRGDRIMDFSFAGYMGGGAKIPHVPVKATVNPTGGDDSAAIQSAIDAVSKMNETSGFRGAILLAPGDFHCDKTLTIETSGVVLRGSGVQAGGTTIHMTGSPHVCIAITGAMSSRTIGSAAKITDGYVPSGATSFNVADASAFKAGDLVHIIRPVTPAWIAFMGMDKLVRDGKREHWISGQVKTERVIQAVTARQIVLDIPLSDSLDAKYLDPPGASVVKVAITGRISQVGVEDLQIVAMARAVGLEVPQQHGVHMGAVADGWLKDLKISDTVGTVEIGSGCTRVTVRDVSVTHSVATTSAAKPADFTVNGTQILFQHCTSSGSNLFYFVTGGGVSGPNVLLDCTFQGNGHIQPHMRWATGLLVDSSKVPAGGIDFMNRGEMGSGHGWTIGWAVAWNCQAGSYVIQQPPGATNWAIGCMGKRQSSAMPFQKSPMLPDGIFDSHGVPVEPQSLYLAQLRDRLGEQAVKDAAD
jgi:hypothetical protein